MALREITDGDGRRWRVWDTYPRRRESGRSVIAEDFAAGWLTFESDGEKRRLAPVPEGWDEREPEMLLLLLRDADPVASASPT